MSESFPKGYKTLGEKDKLQTMSNNLFVLFQ